MEIRREIGVLCRAKASGDKGSVLFRGAHNNTDLILTYIGIYFGALSKKN